MRQKELGLLYEEEKGGRWLNIVLYVLILILVSLIIFFNLVSLCSVDGISMNNTLENEQCVLLLKGKNANRGDVIVFTQQLSAYGETEERFLIKRVIAKENERFAFVTDSISETVAVYYEKSPGIFCKDDKNYGGKAEIAEDIDYNALLRYHQFKVENGYRVFKTDSFSDSLEIPEEYLIKVDAGCYFVMGDNRNISADSREFGFVDKNSVYGRMILKLNKGSVLEKIFLAIYGTPSAQ